MMTSKERLLAAAQCQPVDYVPLAFHFWPHPRHPQAIWNNDRERLAFYRAHEWDARVDIGAGVSPLPEVQVEVDFETRDDYTVLHQCWHTPAGTIEERLRVTDDWPGTRDSTNPVGFSDDFRTSRYLEFPFKTPQDLATLPYLFPLENPRDTEQIIQQHHDARTLADEFEVPLFAYFSGGMDWLIWLYPAEEAVLRTQDEPEMVHALLNHINAAFTTRLKTTLELGVDAVVRRGWYESADFWNPSMYTEFACPALKQEIALAHAAGTLFFYLMDTGIMPILDQLAALPFDCLLGADPATSNQDLVTIRRALPGKALWGGVSGPLHLGMGTPAEVEQVVEQAFATCGNTGFILGSAVGYRYDWPWENLLAFERAWKKGRARTQG